MRGAAPAAAVVALLLAVVAVYHPVVGHEFVNLDDKTFLVDNPNLDTGLSLEGLRWVFTSVQGWWFPLTWVSWLADQSIHGLSPSGAHLANLLLHLANVLLLLGALHALTGSFWRSAVVAAVFALHPGNVESVAWVTERKGVLSGFFFFATLWAWAGWTRGARGRAGYLGVCALVALGLLAKPMLVTLPFVLLLLDFWPLGRARREGADDWRLDPARIVPLVVEKLPLFALAAASSAVTFFVQERAGAMAELESLPFGIRLANAVLAYGGYLRVTVWPSGLAPLYPHPGADLSWAAVAVSALLLVGISAAVWRGRRSRPGPLVGWLWFVGMLVPTLGLVQVGKQASADRYLYLSQVGLVLALVWSIPPAWLAERAWRRALAGASLAVLLAFAVVSSAQVAVWHDTRTLFEHMVRVTAGNDLGLRILAAELIRQDEIDEAARRLDEAARIRPDTAATEALLAEVRARQGRSDEAIAHYRRALALEPVSRDGSRAGLRRNAKLARHHFELAALLLQSGDAAGAVTEYRGSLELEPDFALAHVGLGRALLRTGQDAEARRELERALELEPGLPAAHGPLAVLRLRAGDREGAIESASIAVRANPRASEMQVLLGNLLTEEGRDVEAAAHLRAALALQPDSPRAANNLAWLLATSPDPALRDPREAVRWAEAAVASRRERDPRRRAACLDTLSLAYAAAGRPGDARATAGSALEAAEASGAHALAEEIRKRSTKEPSSWAQRE